MIRDHISMFVCLTTSLLAVVFMSLSTVPSEQLLYAQSINKASTLDCYLYSNLPCISSHTKLTTPTAQETITPPAPANTYTKLPASRGKTTPATKHYTPIKPKTTQTSTHTNHRTDLQENMAREVTKKHLQHQTLMIQETTSNPPTNTPTSRKQHRRLLHHHYNLHFLLLYHGGYL